VRKAISMGGLVATIACVAYLSVELVGTIGEGEDLRGVATEWLGLLGLVLGLGIVGTMLAWHRPSQPIGWLLLGFAVTTAARSVAEVVAVGAHEAVHGRCWQRCWRSRRAEDPMRSGLP
jgi:hypothetical protein